MFVFSQWLKDSMLRQISQDKHGDTHLTLTLEVEVRGCPGPALAIE